MGSMRNQAINVSAVNQIPLFWDSAPPINLVGGGANSKETSLSHDKRLSRSSDLSPVIWDSNGPLIDITRSRGNSKYESISSDEIGNRSTNLHPLVTIITHSSISRWGDANEPISSSSKLESGTSNLMELISVKLVNISSKIQGIEMVSTADKMSEAISD